VVRLVGGVEGDREQPLLTAARDLRANVEERRCAQAAVLEHDDAARLLDDVEAARLARRGRRVHRRLSLRDADEMQPARARAGCTGKRREQHREARERPRHRR